jgi:lycopene beta-cyclase
MGRTDPLVILGAGGAGLSLAVALREAAFAGPIVLLDRRTAFARDRTWCLWDTPGVRFTELATHRWPAWQVVSPDGAATRQDGPDTPYLHLRADDVYAAALARLGDEVELRLGVRVTALREEAGHVTVGTSQGPVRAAHVVDALGGPGPLRHLRPSPPDALRQTFLGQEVRTERPVFDPGVATLMDFRIDQSGGVRFVYVLPFAADRALVEDTSIGTAAVPAARRRAAIGRYLTDHHGVRPGGFAVEHEERGVIPMTTAPRPVRISQRLTAVGLAGGAARPSSGYAFARIQQQVDAVAAALAGGTPVPARTTSTRLDLMDRVFLDVLREDPGAFPHTMASLLRGAPADVVARFMNDASSPLDEARLAAAMPTTPFARAAIGAAPALAVTVGAAAVRRVLGQ